MHIMIAVCVSTFSILSFVQITVHSASAPLPYKTSRNKILNFLDWMLLEDFHLENVNFHGLKMVDTSKTGCYWAEEHTSQLHCCSRVEVNKFLLAYVILLKQVYFRQHFACLRKRIFNCCKRNTVKLKLKFAIEWRWLSLRLQAAVDAIFSPFLVVT